MKNLYGILLALCSMPALAHYELKAVSSSDEDIDSDDVEQVQEAVSKSLGPLIEEWNKQDNHREIIIEPIVDRYRAVSLGKRIFLGPLARGAELTMRIKITYPESSQERTFSDGVSSWHSTFTAGAADRNVLKHVIDDIVAYVSEIHAKSSEQTAEVVNASTSK